MSAAHYVVPGYYPPKARPPARAVIWPSQAASSSASSSAPKAVCIRGSVLLQFNRDKDRFTEIPEDPDVDEPTADIPQVTAPTEEIPIDLETAQDDATLNQYMLDTLADISPTSGQEMALALGLLADVDHCSESSSDMS